MRKRWTVWLIGLSLLVGCVSSSTPPATLPVSPVIVSTIAAPSPTAVPATEAVAIEARETAQPTPATVVVAEIATARPTVIPAPTDTLPPTEKPLPTPDTTTATDELSLTREDVTLFPVPFVAEGDQVTFQIRPNLPTTINAYAVEIEIAIDGQAILTNTLSNNIDLGNSPGLLAQWAWNAGTPGEHTVVITLDPQDRITEGDVNAADNRVEFALTVQPSQTLGVLAGATWTARSSAFANIYFVSGTAAERDQDQLLANVDAAVQEAAAILGIIPNRKVDVYFIDRVIGQGGYAGGSIVISYPERNYAGGGLQAVLVHESIHILDDALINGTEYRFWTEGLAVYGTGGHYKAEQLNARAAALLLETNRYVPLPELINNFYPAQHEVGYLQAGAFVQFMVETYSWERVKGFYGNMNDTAEGEQPATAVSKTMEAYFGKTLVQLETDWHTALRAQQAGENALDLELTIAFYDTMRAYQQQYDPTAYFLNAWLPSADYMRRNNLTGALTRHPEQEDNIVYETLLTAADQALRSGNYARTQSLLNSVQLSLDTGQFLDPLAASYLDLVRVSAELGYEAQAITLNNNQTATVEVTLPGDAQVITLNLKLENQQWIVAQ